MNLILTMNVKILMVIYLINRQKSFNFSTNEETLQILLNWKHILVSVREFETFRMHVLSN